MGLRRLCFLLSVTSVLSLAACGDNEHFRFHDAGTDTNGSGSDDASIDAPPDALTCTTPQIKCGNTCINPTTDNNNCGSCGNACPLNNTCQTDGSSTICCPAGLTNCGGTCVDLSADEGHCGTCGTTCASNQTCDNGTCCGGGTTVCTTASGNQCFDLQVDEGHCGACNIACGANQTCDSGICCDNGKINCNGSCVDPQSDEAHCGGCIGGTPAGVVCTSTQSCEGGICCTTGQANCSGTCTDITTDTHCGSCTTACNSTQDCTASSTNTGPQCCSTGFNNCAGTCSDPKTDNLNCGGCGLACGTGQTCSNGVCCGPGETNCGGTCVDLITDASHCGDCAIACSGATPACSGAQCAANCGPGEVNCSGDCIIPSSDHDNCGTGTAACGHKCAATEVCSAGTCKAACDVGLTSCSGSCVDVTTDANHCGTCGNICPPQDDCVAGQCILHCDPGTTLCNGACYDTSTSEANCGGCVGAGGVACGANQTCDNGLCCDPGFVNLGGLCCPTGDIKCGTQCVDPSTDEAHCGNCNTACTSTQTCNAGPTPATSQCCTNGQILCNGQCVDPLSDEANCGGCGTTTGSVCTSTQTCSNGTCCGSNPLQTACSPGQCYDLQNNSTPGQYCGTCAIQCGSNEVCVNGACTTICPYPPNNCGPGGTNLCTDLTTDEFHCGSCTNVCLTGQTCQPTGSQPVGACSACPSSAPNACGDPYFECTDFKTDVNHCGNCSTSCNIGEQCITGSGQTAGTCCSPGLVACTQGNPATCTDKNTDPNNCGTCGNVCSSGVCTNGQCACGTNETLCTTNNTTTCATLSVDPNNCGQCGHKCTGAGEVCVSGGCITTCPSPLTKCAVPGGYKCVDLQDDSDHCGTCATDCSTQFGANFGCSAALCVPSVQLTNPNPAKCAGGGPPIDVNDGQGGTACTGNLGATAFTYAMCARANIGPLSQQLFTDAFNSTSGPYVAHCAVGGVDDSNNCGLPRCRVTNVTCTGTIGTVGDCQGGTDDICEYRVKCVDDRCVAGGIGINGELSPAISNTANTHVGGDFWVFGAAGLAMKGDTQVKIRLINAGSINVSKVSKVSSYSAVKGPWSTGPNPTMTMVGTLYTEANCPPLSSSILTLLGTPQCVGLNGTMTSGVIAPPAITNWYQPLGSTPPSLPCGTAADLIPIQDYVEYARTHNDDASVGVSPDLFDAGSTTIRLDLPCGIFYFNQLNIGKDTTIYVHGRTAIFIGGAARVSQKLIFDLDPNATLDIFVGAVVNVSNVVILGSPAYPRLSRLWIGGTSCLGTGTCQFGYECCSGTCNAGVCGTNGGGNLAQAMSLSNGGSFNGLIYAGRGTFTHSGPLEMYGAIFTNHFDASGDTIIHYDKGAVKTFEECPAPAPNQSCESCRQCANQACVGGKCGSCTSDSQCCPPLTCSNGTCI